MKTTDRVIAERPIAFRSPTLSPSASSKCGDSSNPFATIMAQTLGETADGLASSSLTPANPHRNRDTGSCQDAPRAEDHAAVLAQAAGLPVALSPAPPPAATPRGAFGEDRAAEGQAIADCRLQIADWKAEPPPGGGDGWEAGPESGESAGVALEPNHSDALPTEADCRLPIADLKSKPPHGGGDGWEAGPESGDAAGVALEPNHPDALPTETPTADLTEEPLHPDAEATRATASGPSSAGPERENSAGTSVAKTVTAMIAAEKMNDSAGGNEQFLPSEEYSADSRVAGKLARETQPTAHALDFSAGIANAFATSTPPSHGEASTAAPALAATAVRTAEHTFEMVSDHAVRLLQLGADTLSVSIRPDSRTELLLELRVRGDGQLEARAEMQRGDYSGLSAQWSELQERLGRQGVRLASLAQEANAQGAGADTSAFSRRGHSPSREPAELAPAANAHPLKSLREAIRPTLARRGLELYA